MVIQLFALKREGRSGVMGMDANVKINYVSIAGYNAVRRCILFCLIKQIAIDFAGFKGYHKP